MTQTFLALVLATNCQTSFMDGYSCKSGAWDSFLLNAIHELHQRAMKKDQDELLSDSCKKVYVENYFNELFAKKD